MSPITQMDRKASSSAAFSDDLKPPSRRPSGLHRRKSSVLPTPAELDKENVVETQNALMRQHWNKAMHKELGSPDRYQSVAVLIVRWVEALDKDLQCWKECDELDKLFRERFSYSSKVVALNNQGKKPQIVLNSAIARFVEEHDGPHRSHLLVVYYSGHGISKTREEEESLFVAGVQDPSRPDQREGAHTPIAEWSRAEAPLQDADADVLVIMDCCNAGLIMKSMVDDTRAYEIMSATGAGLTTPKPGPRSYTRALIDSLKDELAKSERHDWWPLDTYNLNQEIKRRKNWSHLPQLFHRNQIAKNRHICLAPLQKPREQSSQSLGCSATLRLQLVFSERTTLKEKEITHLATALAKGAKDSNLTITALEWMGFAPEQKTPQQTRRLLVMSRAMWVLAGWISRWKTKKHKLALARAMPVLYGCASRFKTKKRRREQIEIEGVAKKRPRVLLTQPTLESDGSGEMMAEPVTPPASDTGL